jgi:hypothetical protein
MRIDGTIFEHTAGGSTPLARATLRKSEYSRDHWILEVLDQQEATFLILYKLDQEEEEGEQEEEEEPVARWFETDAGDRYAVAPGFLPPCVSLDAAEAALVQFRKGGRARAVEQAKTSFLFAARLYLGEFPDRAYIQRVLEDLRREIDALPGPHARP